MQTQNLTIVNSLYALYENLPDDIQQAFLQKLFQKQRDKLENMITCRQTHDEKQSHGEEKSDLDELIGTLATQEVEEMQDIIEGELPL